MYNDAYSTDTLTTYTYISLVDAVESLVASNSDSDCKRN